MYDNIVTLGNEFMLSLCDLISEEHPYYYDENVIGHRTDYDRP